LKAGHRRKDFEPLGEVVAEDKDGGIDQQQPATSKRQVTKAKRQQEPNKHNPPPTTAQGQSKSQPPTNANQQQEPTKSPHVTFNAYDPDVLELLPKWIVAQLPFKATRRGALDLVTLEMINPLMVTEGSFAGVQKRLKELMHIQFYQDMYVYYHYAAWLQQRWRKSVVRMQQQLPVLDPPMFGCADDPNLAYSLHVPCAQYLTQS
jgi:hypothetical protein